MHRDEILNWLLEEDNPPVRLLTLTRLLHRPETDPEVQETRDRLMTYSVTQGILAHSDTFWQGGGRSFWSYKGKHWNTVYLGHFYADGHDPRIEAGVQRLLDERGWVQSNCFQFRSFPVGTEPAQIRKPEKGSPISGATAPWPTSLPIVPSAPLEPAANRSESSRRW